jgi:hypothetical protein
MTTTAAALLLYINMYIPTSKKNNIWHSLHMRQRRRTHAYIIYQHVYMLIYAGGGREAATRDRASCASLSRRTHTHRRAHVPRRCQRYRQSKRASARARERERESACERER